MTRSSDAPKAALTRLFIARFSNGSLFEIRFDPTRVSEITRDKLPWPVTDRDWGIILGRLRAIAIESGRRMPASKPRKPGRIKAPPGSRISAFSEYCLSQKVRERIVIPVISDMREEYYAALASRRRVLAVAVKIRGGASLCVALVGHYTLALLLKWLVGAFASGSGSSR